MPDFSQAGSVPQRVTQPRHNVIASADVRLALIEIVSIYGRAVCENQQRIQNLLYDYCGDAFRPAIRFLMLAHEEEVPADLLKLDGRIATAAALGQLAERLKRNLMATESAAQWAVETWAAALDLVPTAPKECRAPLEISASPHSNEQNGRGFSQIAKGVGTLVRVLALPLLLIAGTLVGVQWKNAPIDPLDGVTRSPDVIPTPSARPKTAPAPERITANLGRVRDDNGLNLKLVWCPPGHFQMGIAAIDVTLTNGFWLGQNEVTQSQWQRVMQTTPWKGSPNIKEGDEYPATYVSYDDATQFCELLTTEERRAGRLPDDWKYALPTEAQWEYACRAGSNTTFSFGDSASELGQYAWYQDNAESIGEKYAHLVNQKNSNPWGLNDMHGNVREWCAGYMGSQVAGGTDPEGIESEWPKGVNRGYRGGSWGDPASGCTSTLRFRDFPFRRTSTLGFRVARTLSLNSASAAR
jgi:formylglycine-generating enzyme required for sulfatase activity